MRGNHNKKNPADLTPSGIKRNATNILTAYLKRLGKEAYTVDDAGDPVTRFEALAQLVWDKALGHTEKITLDDGSCVETVHKPDRAFIGMIFDRVEGRVVPVAAAEDKGKKSLADRIGEQSKVRLNRLAKSDD